MNLTLTYQHRKKSIFSGIAALFLLFALQANAQKVGVNTATPQSSLDVSGNATIGSSYAGNIPAPPDGAVIEGNVGIGTILPFYKLSVFSDENEVAELASDSPVGAWLRLRNTSTGGTVWNLASTGEGNSEGAGSLLFRDASHVRMMINPLGNVGIGTSSPAQRLHVNGTARFDGKLTINAVENGELGNELAYSRLEMHSNSSNESDLNLALFEDSDYSPWLNFAHARGTDNAPTMLNQGDDLFSVWGHGYDGTGFLNGGGIKLTTDSVVGAGSMPTKLRFFTTSGGFDYQEERMVIDRNGNVGIGQTAPIERLNVNGNVLVENGTLNINNEYWLPATPGTAGQFLMSNGGGPTTWATPAGGGGIGWQLDGNTNGEFRSIGTQDDYDLGIISNGEECIRVASTGLVGIGTTAPTSKLDVDGAMGWKVKSPLAVGTEHPDHTGGIWVYSSGTGTITLPAPGDCTNRMYVIVNRTGAACDISGYTDLGGASQTTLAHAASIWIVSDGTGWLQIK